MENILRFKGPFLKGEIDLNASQMTSVPTKEQYNEVDLTLTNESTKGLLQIACIDGESLAFEEKVKLGAEIEKRWNEHQEFKALLESNFESMVSQRDDENWTKAQELNYQKHKRALGK